jgi:hypothetical protein
MPSLSPHTSFWHPAELTEEIRLTKEIMSSFDTGIMIMPDDHDAGLGGSVQEPDKRLVTMLAPALTSS